MVDYIALAVKLYVVSTIVASIAEYVFETQSLGRGVKVLFLHCLGVVFIPLFYDRFLPGLLHSLRACPTTFTRQTLITLDLNNLKIIFFELMFDSSLNPIHIWVSRGNMSLDLGLNVRIY